MKLEESKYFSSSNSGYSMGIYVQPCIVESHYNMYINELMYIFKGLGLCAEICF